MKPPKARLATGSSANGKTLALSQTENDQSTFSIIVRTYDTASGELLWEDRFYPEDAENDDPEEGTAFEPVVPDSQSDQKTRSGLRATRERLQNLSRRSM